MGVARLMIEYLKVQMMTQLEAARRPRTQAALAAEAGVSQALIAQIENGWRSTGIAAQRLAAHLGLEVEDLARPANPITRAAALRAMERATEPEDAAA
jgi:hypothetical protein